MDLPSRFSQNEHSRTFPALAKAAFLQLLLVAFLHTGASAQPTGMPRSAAATQPPLAISFAGSAVHITGATANGQVALVSVMREPSRRMLVRLTDTQQLLPSSGAGTVDFALGRQVPACSVWAAVDLASGHYAFATPPGFVAQELPFPASVVKNTPATDAYDELQNSHFLLHMLWVHTGQGNQAGAWFTRVADGGTMDRDEKNDGQTLTTTEQFAPLGTSGTSPKKIKKDDVLIMIDPFEMQYFATTVTK